MLKRWSEGEDRKLEKIVRMTVEVAPNYCTVGMFAFAAKNMVSILFKMFDAYSLGSHL